MDVSVLKSFDLGVEAGFLHSASVHLGDREAVLFVYSAGIGVDPGEELFQIKGIEPVHLALFEMDGRRLWDKTLPDGVLPGIWFMPTLPFDLDGDGVDEIYVLNNTGAPFSFMHRKLTRLDALTGEMTGAWPWPWNTFEERMSLSYRFYVLGGYVRGEPVLVTCQGTYANMYLQCWNGDTTKRWEIVIRADAPGPRASHVTPVIDINGDGVDELFWGERILSLDDGHEIIDLAPDYNGHSDVIIPMLDYKTDEWYIFTCREGDERPGLKRVVTFRLDGSVAWDAVDYGHMHTAWCANTGDRYEKMVMVMRNRFDPGESGLGRALDSIFYFDAFSGEPVAFDPPCKGTQMQPVDLNGDGWHEFVVLEGEMKGMVLNRFGKPIARLPGDADAYADGTVRIGKLFDAQGEHIMIQRRNSTQVHILGDADARDGDIMRRRYTSPYLRFMQKIMASGYNCVGSQVSCGI